MNQWMFMLLIACALAGISFPAKAQVVTLATNNGNLETELYRMDMCNCETTEVICARGKDGAIATNPISGLAYGYLKVTNQQELFTMVSPTSGTSFQIIREEVCKRIGIDNDYSRYKLMTIDTEIGSNMVWFAGDSLYKFDHTVQRIIKEYGAFAPKQAESITWHDGKLYAVWQNEILEVDTFNPAASIVKFILPFTKADIPDLSPFPSRVHLVSYPTDCGTWITYLFNTAPVALGTFKRGIYRIDMDTGELTFTCPATNPFFNHVKGQAMLPDTLECVELKVDLDDDDSSGEAPINYRHVGFCPHDEVSITDLDFIVTSRGRDPDSIVIILNGQVENDLEFLTVSNLSRSVTASNNNQDTLILVSLGDAKGIDFKNALSKVKYINNSRCPQAGERQVHIIMYACAYQSEEVIAFIDIPDIPCSGRDTSLVLCDDVTSFDLFDLLGPQADIGGTWSPNKPVFDPKIDPAGKYIYTINRGICPPDSAILDIQVGSTPIFNLGNDTSFCDLINLSLGGGQIADRYRWSTGSRDSSILINQSGLYILTLTNNPGCDYSDTINIRFDSDTVINLGIYNLCEGDSMAYWDGWISEAGIFNDTLRRFSGCDSILIIEVKLNQLTVFSLGADTSICSGSMGVDIILDPQINAMNYLWQDGSSNSTLKINDTGTYWVEITNDNGCKYRDSIIVNVGLAQKTDLGIIELCHGDSLIVGTNTLRKSGTYTDTIQSITGCDSIITLDLIVHPAFQNPISGDTLLCEGDSAQLISSIGLHDIVWSTGERSKEINVKISGRYGFTAMDDNDCPLEAFINVRFNPPPQLDVLVKSETCRGQNDGIIEIINVGGQSDYTYLLDGQVINSTRIEDLTSGTYIILVTDKFGCTTNKEIMIDSGTEISTDLGSDIEISTIDTTLQISANILSGSTAKITWFVDGAEYGNGENPIDFSPTGDHTIKVIIEDENGCISEDIMQIIFRLNTDIYIPNTFSPNGDGINDWLEVFTKEDNNFDIKMTVYDRWGNLVYQSLQGEKPKWDGRFKGKNLPSAVYVYILEFKDASDKLIHNIGDVTLLK